MKLKGLAGSESARSILLMAVCLLGVLLVLFGGALARGHVLFSNDGPLGAITSSVYKLPGLFTGSWFDLNTLGNPAGAGPNITYGLQWLIGPLWYSKVFAIAALFLLGMGAWTFFRQLGLAPAACLLGGLAAALNGSFLSAAAWGMSPHPIAIGMSYFALAALAKLSGRGVWIRVALAGLAVGLSVAEGADIGAIFSLGVAAFVMYQAWAERGKSGIPLGILRTAVVALMAAFMAAQTIFVLVGTAISGVAGMAQDERTKEERWDWATQWSLPKREALSVFIPGLYGYRMDTPDGGNYWGAVGREPAWDRYFAGGRQGPPPQGFIRYTGGSIYAGILVAMIGVWASLQSFRKRESVFGVEAKKWIWFWTAVVLVSLLLAFGRHAPFYRLLYALPYFSTIRNPAKFGHVVNWALVVLFAYGVHGLWQHYVTRAGAIGRLDIAGWWRKVRGFDRNWTIGSMVAFGVSVLGWLIYGSSRKEFVEYLQQVQFDASMAQEIAAFSSRQFGAWLLFFLIAIFLVTLVVSGAFSGSKARWGVAFLGLFLVVDLGRANKPFIIVWDYEQKYATNPLIEKLREKPYLRRVAIMPGWMQQLAPPESNAGLLEQIYRIEWAQHHFYYFDIQSLDIVQMPRMPEDLTAFEAALQPRQSSDLATLVPRRWELTSTRYLLGVADYLPYLNTQLDPIKKRFRIAERFTIVPKPGVEQPRKYEELTAVFSTNGPYALFEFTGALPRASMYRNWEVVTNAQETLKTLASSAFDPWKTVLLPEAPIKGAQPSTNAIVETVEFASYAPKRIVLEAEPDSPSVLMLADRFDPNWHVYVDGKKEPLLRPNYLMRGVFLQPGKHTVEFRFEPPVNTLYVSVAGWGVGALLILALVFWGRRESPPSRPDAGGGVPAA